MESSPKRLARIERLLDEGVPSRNRAFLTLLDDDARAVNKTARQLREIIRTLTAARERGDPIEVKVYAAPASASSASASSASASSASASSASASSANGAERVTIALTMETRGGPVRRTISLSSLEWTFVDGRAKK